MTKKKKKDHKPTHMTLWRMEKISEQTHVYKSLGMSFLIFSSLPIWHEKCYLTVASLFIPSDYICYCPSFQIFISYFYFLLWK